MGKLHLEQRRIKLSGRNPHICKSKSAHCGPFGITGRRSGLGQLEKTCAASVLPVIDQKQNWFRTGTTAVSAKTRRWGFRPPNGSIRTLSGRSPLLAATPAHAPNPTLLRFAIAMQREPRGRTRELSPNFGDGVKDQAAAWLKRAVREQQNLFSADVVLIEDKASGTQLIQELIEDG